jgi:tRNA A37 threonylcarbamoyladenosine biosynthesis protein TsaE
MDTINIKTYIENILNENETLKTQLDIAHTDNKRLAQLIKILADAFKRYTHLPSAVTAIEWSKEATEKSYRDLKILEMVLEDIERGVKSYED